MSANLMNPNPTPRWRHPWDAKFPSYPAPPGLPIAGKPGGAFGFAAHGPAQAGEPAMQPETSSGARHDDVEVAKE